MAAILVLLTGTAFGLEIAELRNGFTIPHHSRESRSDQVRLYLDERRISFVDVPSAEIERYTSAPDPEPIAEFTPEKVAPAKMKTTGQIVSEAADKHGVDSDFIQSVIRQESSGNAKAVSRAGARGLMQLMPGTAAQLGVKDSFSPEQNVHGGTQYLKELLERYNGDAVKALAAYNAGPAAVDRYKGVPPYRETRQYVQRIVRDYNKSKASATKAKTAEKPKTATLRAVHATVESASN